MSKKDTCASCNRSLAPWPGESISIYHDGRTGEVYCSACWNTRSGPIQFQHWPMVVTGQETPLDARPLREIFADIAHASWSGWTAYFFSKFHEEDSHSMYGGDDFLLLEKEFADRWKRQMVTPYADLSEAEKESDRKEADKYLAYLPKLPDAVQTCVKGIAYDLEKATGNIMGHFERELIILVKKLYTAARESLPAEPDQDVRLRAINRLIPFLEAWVEAGRNQLIKEGKWPHLTQVGADGYLQSPPPGTVICTDFVTLEDLLKTLKEAAK